MVEHMMARLGIITDKGAPIMNALLKAARTYEIGFDKMFFDLYGGNQPDRGIYNTEAFMPYFAALKAANAQFKPRTHAYFKADKPASLVIDEVERIWAPIAEQDDWTAFEDKLSHIRSYGEALS